MPVTLEASMIKEYSGINFSAQKELDMVEYMLYIRDAYISKLNQTESGRDYLEQCWISEQTEPDRDALRAEFDIREV